MIKPGKVGRWGLALVVGALVLSISTGSAGATPRPLGVDVSRFDGAIAWPSVAGAGVSFAFVEASRGSGADCTTRPLECGADPNYATNYAAARAAGLRVGAYQRAFASGATPAEARADAATEAALFTTQVGALHHGDLLPVLDVETPFTGLNPVRLRVWIHTWLKQVEAKLGAKPIIYTNASSWGATGNTTGFATHRLWIANHDVARPLVPAANWARHSWSIWQFTSSATVPGILGKADGDRLRVGFSKISAR